MTDEIERKHHSKQPDDNPEAEALEASKSAGASQQPDELPADLPAAYQRLLAEKQELYDRMLRKQAELENIRKRIEREKEDFLQHATMGLIRALLPTLDALERALKHRDENVPHKFVQGMELIHHELLDVLKRAGLTPVESEGKIFDPHVHQAVETVEVEGHRDQEVLEELQRGYKLKHRLLRPAIVKVAVSKSGKSGPGREENGDPDDDGSENFPGKEHSAE